MSGLSVYCITFEVLEDYDPAQDEAIVDPLYARLERIGATFFDASFIFGPEAAGIGAAGTWTVSGVIDAADFSAALAKAAEACAGIGDKEVFSIGVHEAAREDYGM